MGTVPFFISQTLYDQAKALGMNMTGYVVVKPLPKIKGSFWKTVYTPHAPSHFFDSFGCRIERKPPAQSFSLRPGAINWLGNGVNRQTL